jgi:hypothetical protein
MWHLPHRKNKEKQPQEARPEAAPVGENPESLGTGLYHRVQLSPPFGSAAS